MAIKIKIVEISDYMQATRNIREGDTYEVIRQGYSCDLKRQVCYLFESKNGKPSLAYEHEVKILKN